MPHLHQISQIAKKIFKDGDCAVAGLKRFACELDADRFHALIVAPKIIGLQEEKDAPAGLVADEGLMLGFGGAGE
jgi:hypothetical protein